MSTPAILPDTTAPLSLLEAPVRTVYRIAQVTTYAYTRAIACLVILRRVLGTLDLSGDGDGLSNEGGGGGVQARMDMDIESSGAQGVNHAWAIWERQADLLEIPKPRNGNEHGHAPPPRFKDPTSLDDIPIALDLLHHGLDLLDRKVCAIVKTRDDLVAKDVRLQQLSKRIEDAEGTAKAAEKRAEAAEKRAEIEERRAEDAEQRYAAAKIKLVAMAESLLSGADIERGGGGGGGGGGGRVSTGGARRA